jgi:predicted RND superfamily exporter protein
VNAFVSRLGALVTRAPAAVLAVMLLVTVVLGSFAAQQEFDADMAGFAPEGELQALDDRIDEEFGSGQRQVQVIVDAGRGGDVLTSEGLAVAERLEEAILDREEVADLIDASGPNGEGVITYASPMVGQLEQLGTTPEEASQAFIDSAVDEALSGQRGDRIRGLLSEDFDGERARGGLAVVTLDPDAPREQVERAHLALEDVVQDVDRGFFDADAFSFVIVQAEMEQSMERDMPVLLGASFLLIILILAFQFRRASDVVLGVVGLASSVIWMAGISVLLGPDHLGITGTFSQIAMAVPVLLVGLGIDYSVHLTARYREERARGADAATSANTAVITVGVALTLATLTTAIGFLANWLSPLPPIADFGLFAGAGIVSAAVVLGLLVPSARVLLDRRAEARGSATPTRPAPERRALSWLPAHAPVATVVAGLALALVAGGLASGLDTTFSQDDFIPEDSQADVMLTRLDDLFGGDISERTQVLVDGDVRDPEAFQLLLDAEEDLAEISGVRTVDGRADITSPASVVRELDRTSDATRRQLAARFALEHDPAAAADQAALPDDLTFGDLPADLRAEMAEQDDLPADDAELPVDDLEALERRLPPGVSGVEALLRTLPGADLVDLLREGIAEQLEDEAPDVEPAVLAGLAGTEPGDLTAQQIRESGYPVDELSDDALELLETGERLEELGWQGDRVADDADVAAILALTHEQMGDLLTAVLSDDAALLEVSTQAGETGAAELADAIAASLADLDATVAGGIGVVSDQLLIDVTLEQLTASQINAIVLSLLAAMLLLTIYYGVVARRPLLGPITMLPALLSVPLILGTMRVVGLSFNALTATVSSIAIGIGVPYGIHVTNRFLEERTHGADTPTTISWTLRHTGAALVGSAVTTASGFAVLVLSDLTPLQQFGGVTSVTIIYALVTALLVESSALVLWDRWHRRREGRDPARMPAQELHHEPAPEPAAATLVRRARPERP